MGRRLRVEFKGAAFHVIQRGNNREPIFEEIADKEFLIKDIYGRKISQGFKLLGFAIMNNHFHLIVLTLDANLHKMMHGINNRYSKYYNHRHERTGHLGFVFKG